MTFRVIEGTGPDEPRLLKNYNAMPPEIQEAFLIMLEAAVEAENQGWG
ncbi:MAG: hypothetical protein HOI95_15450 [Chromatiales bacterium]|nr:hypothetical protein [Chromatiales bacterium]